MWTVQLVKEQLPDVPVLAGTKGKVAMCRLSGRKLPFAVVSFGIDGVEGVGGSFECAWETVVHCLNAGKPIRF